MPGQNSTALLKKEVYSLNSLLIFSVPRGLAEGPKQLRRLFSHIHGPAPLRRKGQVLPGLLYSPHGQAVPAQQQVVTDLRKEKVDVDFGGNFADGQLIVDFRSYTPRDEETYVAYGIDKQKAFKMIKELLRRAN